MATTALGIMQDPSSGVGVDPITHRRIIKAKWANKGVITGLTVSGRTDLRYNVSAGCAVVSRSDSDGFAEAYWEGGTTDAVASGNASNPRIDLVWIKANDSQQGDADNRVHVGVTQGTPSASPNAPSAPAGCLPLMEMRVPAGASSTQSASRNTSVLYAIPYGATLGLLGSNVNTADAEGDSTIRKWFYENQVQFTVPTDRLVELVYSATFTNYSSDWISWGVAAFQLDGVDIPHSGTEWQASHGVWEDHQVSCIVEVTAGTHTVRVRNGMFSSASSGGHPYFRYSAQQGAEYKGRSLYVWDRGVSK